MYNGRAIHLSTVKVDDSMRLVVMSSIDAAEGTPYADGTPRMLLAMLMSAPVEHVPYEILSLMALYLPVADVGTLCQVSPATRVICTDSVFWRNKTLRDMHVWRTTTLAHNANPTEDEALVTARSGLYKAMVAAVKADLFRGRQPSWEPSSDLFAADNPNALFKLYKTHMVHGAVNTYSRLSGPDKEPFDISEYVRFVDTSLDLRGSHIFSMNGAVKDAMTGIIPAFLFTRYPEGAPPFPSRGEGSSFRST